MVRQWNAAFGALPDPPEADCSPSLPPASAAIGDCVCAYPDSLGLVSGGTRKRLRRLGRRGYRHFCKLSGSQPCASAPRRAVFSFARVAPSTVLSGLPRPNAGTADLNGSHAASSWASEIGGHCDGLGSMCLSCNRRVGELRQCAISATNHSSPCANSLNLCVAMARQSKAVMFVTATSFSKAWGSFVRDVPERRWVRSGCGRPRGKLRKSNTDPENPKDHLIHNMNV